MAHSTRRRFLRNTAATGLACSTTLAMKGFSWAQASGNQARIFLDSRRTRASLDRNLFGSFLEHLGRAIYEGIYDPGSKLSDANGFRRDVLDEIKKSGFIDKLKR